MTERKRPLTIEATGVRAARGQVVGDAFNGGQIRRLIIKAKFASYATHRFLTG